MLKKWPGKITSFYVQTGARRSCSCQKLRLLCLWTLAKDFSTIQGTAGSWNVLHYMNDHYIRFCRMHQLLDVPAAAINYVHSNLWCLTKDFSPFIEFQSLEIERPPHQTHHLNIKRKPYKKFNVLNIESSPWQVPSSTFKDHLNTWLKPSSRNKILSFRLKIAKLFFHHLFFNHFFTTNKL